MSNARPRILAITKLAPWRLNGGALIRNYWMIDALAAHFDVDLFTADDAPEAPAEFAAKLQSIQQFPRMRGPQGNIFRGLDALRPGRPLYAAGSVPAKLAQAVATALATTKYAAVQADLNMCAALPRGMSIPLLYNAHNCEYALQKRRAQAEFSGARTVGDRLVPVMMAVDAERLGVLEARILMRSALTAACSDADVDDLRELLKNYSQRAGASIDDALAHLKATTTVIPNGVDTQAYAQLPQRGTDTRTLLITGSMDWRPNRMGLQWFLSDILPELRAQATEPFAVRVAGRMNEKLVQELQRYPEIIAVPNPPRMQDELARANIVVAPITASSGTRLRILEAWAAKRPVVTTTHGALGLEYKNDEDIIVRDDPRAFAAAILQLFESPGQIDAVAGAALVRVAQYDWRPIGRRLVASVEERLILPPDRAVAV